MEVQNNIFATSFYNLYLVSLQYQQKNILLQKLAGKLWAKSFSIFGNKTITSSIHGKKIFLNYGYTYPIICRMFPTYNNPLVELVYQTSKLKESPISLVDIGAAIGDTVLLLGASCQGMIKKYYCVDAEEEFYKYLKLNLSHIDGAVLIKAFLSSAVGMAKNLVKIQPGTASAQGDIDVSTTTLDQLVEAGQIGQFDLLKIDVDGFDGLVLLGARTTLNSYKPTIIFEWHPLLCDDTGNNWIDHFNALEDCGYNHFVFFDNVGNFSHFMNDVDRKAIYSLARILQLKKHIHAEYFDVIAIHNNCPIKPADLATLDYARTHKHPY
jgi:FkbM family methyltransferase